MADTAASLIYELRARVEELDRRIKDLEASMGQAPVKIDGRTLLGKSLKAQPNG